MTFTTRAAELAPRLIALRRRIHAEPEIGLHLPATQRTVLDALADAGIDAHGGDALSSVVAVVRGNTPGPTVLLRGDMDALPVMESSGEPFASANGAMHACGHDLHVSALVGAGILLSEVADRMPGNVVLMFQPGEEGYDGALRMIDEGVLDAAGSPVDAAYAIHVDCTREAGTFATRAGAIMASVSGMMITVTGTGGHAARPHDSLDPVPVAAEIILALQSFVARRVPVTDPVVVSVVDLSTDSAAGNVLPRTVRITANVRTLSRAGSDAVHTALVRMIEQIAAAHECAAVVTFQPSYPVTVNDDREAEDVLGYLETRHGRDRVERQRHPAMASEDFAYVLDRVPGVLLWLGARPRDLARDAAADLHSPHARFDDAVLGLQAETLAELAWRRLHRAP